MKIVVCGAGTVGGNLVEHLCRTGVGEVTVLDHDRVETRNLANQPYTASQVGQPKAKALAEAMYRACGARVQAVGRTLDDGSAPRLLRGAGVVVDALDNSAGRAAVQRACRALGLPCLHVGLSPVGYAEVLWDEGYRVPPDVPGDPCGTPLHRGLSLLAVVVAARALDEFGEGRARGGYTVTLEDLCIQGGQGPGPG